MTADKTVRSVFEIMGARRVRGNMLDGGSELLKWKIMKV